MAQVTRVTSGALNLGSSQAAIDAMRVAIAPGKQINRSDINAFIDLYNTWTQHYHTVSDLIGIDTFGNKTVYGGGGQYTTSTSSTVTGYTPTAVTPAGVAVNSSVVASDINVIVSIINNTVNHYHTINDA